MNKENINILEEITKRKKEIANQVEIYDCLPWSLEVKAKREKLMQEYFELSRKEAEEERKKMRLESSEKKIYSPSPKIKKMNNELSPKEKRLKALERFMFCPCDGVEFSEEQKKKFREANEMLLNLMDGKNENDRKE